MAASKSELLSEIKIMVGTMFVILSAFGLSSYAFSFQRKKFVHSKFTFTYSLVVMVAFTFVYMQQIINEYSSNQFDMRNAEKLYNNINIIAAIISFVNALLLTNYSMQFLNRLQLFNTIIYFYMDEALIKSAIWIVAVKALIFPIALEATLIVRQLRNDPERQLLWTLYNLLPWLIANILPNCFFGSLVITKQLMLELNKRLTEILKEVNCMQSYLQMELQKPYYRMQRFCDLADQLDVLSEKYSLICNESFTFINLLAVPFLCSLLCNLLGITAGLFTHYHAIADTFINEESYDSFNALTNSVFLFVSISDIALQANLSNNTLMAIKETGIILQRMNLLHADIRFKQSVENLSMLVFVTKYKIEPLGLFEVNVSLLLDVLSTVTSFLLILIQSDLSLRFSLK